MNEFRTPILNRAKVVSALLTASAFFLATGFAHADNAVTPVKVIELKQSGLNVERSFFGRVTAKQTVDLAFQVGGQITKFPVLEGDVLKKGALIAKLDPTPFELSLDRAQISKDQADRAAARMKKLKGRAVSQVTADDAVTNASIADVTLRDAQFASDRSVLTAPFDALVASRTVANFTTISAGTTVVRLHDMSELRVEINVPEILFQRIGDNPKVIVEARFPASTERFTMEFREVNAEASQVGQTFQVTFGMTPPEGLLLLPGSSATVHVRFLDIKKGFVVPAAAIRNANDGSVSVLRLEKQESGGERAVETPVEIKIDGDGKMEILSGLAEGDVIVAAGVQDVADGQAVRRFTSF